MPSQLDTVVYRKKAQIEKSSSSDQAVLQENKALHFSQYQSFLSFFSIFISANPVICSSETYECESRIDRVRRRGEKPQSHSSDSEGQTEIGVRGKRGECCAHHK